MISEELLRYALRSNATNVPAYVGVSTYSPLSTNEQNRDHGNQGANDMNYGSRPAAATIAKVKGRQQVSLCNVLVHQPDI